MHTRPTLGPKLCAACMQACLQLTGWHHTPCPLNASVVHDWDALITMLAQNMGLTQHLQAAYACLNLHHSPQLPRMLSFCILAVQGDHAAGKGGRWHPQRHACVRRCTRMPRRRMT